MRPRPKLLADLREFPILYVDDEVENLRIFELAFRREFSILTASSGEEGLRILNENPVAVVLSDHRMPGMTGVEVLSRAAELDPKTMRLLITAYGDAETLSGAINEGAIYRYIPKPWEPRGLRQALRDAIEIYEIDRERDSLVAELSLLNRVSRSLNAELNLSRLMEILATTVFSDLEYDGVSLLLYDETFRGFHWEQNLPQRSPVSERLKGIRIDMSTAPRFLAQMADGELQRFAVEKLGSFEEPIRRWITEVSAETLLVVPLMGQRGLQGLLAVDNRSGGRHFETEDLTLLEGLATQSATAVENARLVQDLRRTRRQVERADRLGTLGTLAAGLAHEINNPLVSIHTFLSLAPSKRDECDDDFWTDYYELACRELDRIRGLVATMSGLGRGSDEKAERESVDLGALGREVAALLRPTVERSGVTLDIDECDEPCEVMAVRDHLHQVVLNLVMNALHAVPHGGTVWLRVHTDASGDEPYAVIEVEDDGPGIAEEHLERIFDPFFTTKGPDQGTGLGLMICHRIVSDHDGLIEVQSARGEGAHFRVRLPQKPREPLRAAPLGSHAA
ncbi:MAG: ATP-binding protein [Proteobacteria bacterium]|nr:ATP-binding protein [Pseudomonadota bacterium]